MQTDGSTAFVWIPPFNNTILAYKSLLLHPSHPFLSVVRQVRFVDKPTRSRPKNKPSVSLALKWDLKNKSLAQPHSLIREAHRCLHAPTHKPHVHVCTHTQITERQGRSKKRTQYSSLCTYNTPSKKTDKRVLFGEQFFLWWTNAASALNAMNAASPRYYWQTHWFLCAWMSSLSFSIYALFQ